MLKPFPKPLLVTNIRNLNLAESEKLSSYNSRLFGALLVNEFFTQAKRRKRDERGKKPKPYYLYIDEFQDFVSPDIAIGLIDEIFIQKKNGLKHPLPIYSKAYEVNPHFRTRSHGEHSFMIMDGKKIKYTIKEDGT